MDGAVTLNQLRFAKAVFDTGSFSRAAAQCCVTQPTLSNGVAQLEKALGGRLFARTTRSVTPTPLGDHVRGLIEEVLSAQAQLVDGARGFLEPDHRMVRIGFSPLVDSQALSVALEPFRRRFPQARVFFKECYLDDLDDRLRAGKIDVALLPALADAPPRVDCRTAPLYDDALMFVDAGGGRAEDGPVSLSAIAARTFVMTPNVCGLVAATRRLFADNGLELSAYPGQALSYQVMLDWADLGIGAAILPARKIPPAARPRARPILLDDGRPARIGFVALWPRRAARAPELKALQDHLSDVAPALIAGAA